MIEIKSLPLSCRKFSPGYAGVLSVPWALIVNLSWSWLLYCIRLLVTDIETRSRQPWGHPFFHFLFVTCPLLFLKVYFSQVFRCKRDFDLEQHIHELNKFRTYFRFLNISSCKQFNSTSYTIAGIWHLIYRFQAKAESNRSNRDWVAYFASRPPISTRSWWERRFPGCRS